MNTLFRLRARLLSEKSFRIGLGGIAFTEALVGVPMLCYGILNHSPLMVVVGLVLTVDGLASTDVLNKLSR